MNRTTPIVALSLTLLAGLSAMVTASPTWAQPTPPPPLLPELSAGVLSEDPGYGLRWSTSIFPFGNYVGPTSGQDVFCRTYLKFPIPSIPQDGNVQATLYAYVDDYWPGPGGAPISVYPVLEEWTPETVDWYDTAAWPELGGAVATSQVTSEGGWFTWDVSRLVWEWGTGARANDGLALAAANLYSTADNWAAARRLTAEDPATRPYLALLIEVPATEVPQTPLPPSPTPTPTPVS
ncbi:MAG: DNRLRE domain-containing protein, partial [Anaerolineae bacterium]|nr:DNRLRE domain-containing protein [Anaerolineae bacterium]